MSYKEQLVLANTALANLSTTRFVGYGLKHSRANGTLIHAADMQIVDTPVAENLLLGVCIGLAMDGLHPVAFFERMDFITNAMDALVNHLDKIPELSNGEFNPSVIIRCNVGSKIKPLFTGAPHTQDLTNGLRMMLKNIIIFRLENEQEIIDGYLLAQHRQNLGLSTILVEYKDLH